MFFLIEHVITVVVALLVVITVAIGLLVGMAIQRRQVRDRYFRRLDELREKYGPIISGVVDGSIEHERGLRVLQDFPGWDRLLMLERLCLEKRPTPEQLPALRQLCEDLGLVEAWQHLLARDRHAAGRARLMSAEGLVQRVGRLEFLVRAKCAENLGIVRHQPSWPLLVKALKDPHPDVRAVAVHSLALIGEPQSFPALMQGLHEIILQPAKTTLSLRTVKTSVVSFPLGQAVELMPSLSHQHRRIRFLATDIIREMVEREAASRDGFVLDGKLFPAALAEAFLTELPADSNPDVRARAAPVIAYLPDNRAVTVLLGLLEDEEWFVRLHTVRALAKHRFIQEVEHIGHCLTDPHWMVREAAVHSLLQLGQTQHLYDVFLRTPDRYSQEQIADEWQRAGVIPALLHKYAQGDGAVESHVLHQLVNMGKTSYVLALLETWGDRGLRKRFVEAFGRHPDPQIQGWVQELAEREPDADLRALARAALPPRG